MALGEAGHRCRRETVSLPERSLKSSQTGWEGHIIIYPPQSVSASDADVQPPDDGARRRSIVAYRDEKERNAGGEEPQIDADEHRFSGRCVRAPCEAERMLSQNVTGI